MGPSLASAEAGMVLNPAPPWRGRMTATASAPGGALSGMIRSVRWPTDASVAMAMPSAKHAHGDVAVGVNHRELPRRLLQSLLRVQADPDAERDEGAKAAVDPGAQRDPFLGRFGGGRG